MTEPNDRQPAFDDAPTTPTQQAPYPSSMPAGQAPNPAATPTAPTTPTAPATSTTPATPIASPLRGPQAAPPPEWQPAGWSGTHESDPITWTPAGQQPMAPKRGGRGRWIVALLVALVIVAGAAGLAVFALSSKTNTAIGPTFLPASTPLYVEARLDLPGGQRDNVIKLLSHFPGFADPSNFDQKIDDLFDRIVARVTSAVTYSTDIEPWFGGQIALGLLQVPSSMGGSGVPVSAGASPGTPASTPTSTPSLSGELKAGALEADAAETHAVIGISVKDRSQLDTLLTGLRAVPGSLQFSQEQYGDHTVVNATRDGTAVGSYSVSDTLLLVASDETDLKTSLDVLDGKQPSLAADAGFISAMKGLPTERLGAVYTAPSFYQAMATGMANLQAPTSALGETTQSMQCLMPSIADPSTAVTAAAIVADGDSVTLESTSTGLPAMPTKTATDLAAHMPADDLVYAEIPKVGGSLHDLVACLRTAMPDTFSTDQIAQIEKLLGTKLQDYLSFITDVGIGVSYDGTTYHWGLVASVADDATAQSRVATLVAAAKLAAGLGQAQFTVTDQQVAGATVTTMTLTNSNPTGGLPIEPSISVAVSAGHLYLGDGDFSAAAISRAAADSLGSNQRYTSALAAAGTVNGLTIYVDVNAVRQQIEAAQHVSQSYIINRQPYLMPFDRLMISADQDANTLTGRIQLFVK